MASDFSSNESSSHSDFLRRHARRMLNAAHSDHPSAALPVLRRVHAAGVLPLPRLTDIHRERHTLQLKHMLHTLAKELGYAAWDACKRDIDHRPTEVLDRFRMDLGEFGDYHRLWFADESAARNWQQENGGRVVVYGSQAAVVMR